MKGDDLFNRLMENVELFLDYERVHADLSAFNVLYWEGEVKIIDFPQAINPWMNTNAFFLLARDIERMCQYFGRFGIEANPVELASDLWRQYMGTLGS